MNVNPVFKRLACREVKGTITYYTGTCIMEHGMLTSHNTGVTEILLTGSLNNKTHNETK